jgi:hypothetical protein
MQRSMAGHVPARRDDQAEVVAFLRSIRACRWRSAATRQSGSNRVQVEPLGAARIRPIRPKDESLYAAFFARLMPEDQRLRFFV